MRILTFLAALLIATGALAFGENERILVMEETEVSTAGGAVNISIRNPRHSTGYLVVKTDNLTAAPSLVVVVQADTPLGYFDLCTLSAITTDTTTVALIGHDAAASEGITDVCDFPMTERLYVTFTMTGAGADFDVTAYFEMVADY